MAIKAQSNGREQMKTAAQQTIDASYTYIGNGTFSHLAPVVTEAGRAAGWNYRYPIMLNLHGVNYSEFTTLDQLLADGMITLQRVTTTLV